MTDEEDARVIARRRAEEAVAARRREDANLPPRPSGLVPAGTAIESALLEHGAVEMARWTDKQWADHDAKVRDSLAADQRLAVEEARRERRRYLEEAGADRNELSMHLTKLMRGEFKIEPDHRSVLAWHGGGIAIVQGLVGRGKTWLGLEWLLRHPSPSPGFVHAASLFNVPRGSPEGQEQTKRWKAAGAFVLDDLGVEDMTKDPTAKLGYLESIIDIFQSGHRSLLITTNMPRTVIAERYGQRIESRLARASWHVVRGEDRRVG